MSDAPSPDFTAMFRPNLNDDEAEWAELEPAWADFLHATRTGHRAHLRAHSLRGQTFLQTHNSLDVHRRHFQNGEKYHLFVALCACAKERVPMPYWVADALLELSKAMNTDGTSLHDLFGADKHYPPSPAKRAKISSTRALELEIYKEVSILVYLQGMTLNHALDVVLEKPEFKGKIGKTKARASYCHRDALQNEFLEADSRRQESRESEDQGQRATSIQRAAADFAIEKMQKNGMTIEQASSVAMAVTRYRIAITLRDLCSLVRSLTETR